MLCGHPHDMHQLIIIHEFVPILFLKLTSISFRANAIMVVLSAVCLDLGSGPGACGRFAQNWFGGNILFRLVGQGGTSDISGVVRGVIA